MSPTNQHEPTEDAEVGAESATSRAPSDRSRHPEVHWSLVELGARIRRARVARDISLLELGNRIGVQRRTLSRLERGAPGVSIETFALVLWHLNLLGQMARVLEADPEGMRLAEMRRPSRARSVRMNSSSRWASLKKL